MKKPDALFVVVLILVLCGLVALLAFHPKNKSHTVKLTWRAPDSAKDPTRFRYNIYRKPVSGGDYVRIATKVEGLSYVDSLVNHGMTYVYVVRTVDEHERESKNSTQATAIVP